MAIETFKEMPEGVKAVWGYLQDDSLTSEERSQVLRIAQNLSQEANAFTPRGGRNMWVELLYYANAVTTISATSTETIMVPDFTLPANYLMAGRGLRYTLIGDFSSAITTPGTWTQRLRYGGVGGTIIGVGTAYTPDTTAAGTTVPFIVEWWMIVRSEGTSGSVWVQGRQMTGDTIATTAGLGVQFMPQTGPAAVTINTTTANALSPTSAASLTTGSLRTNLAFLEAMN